MSILDNARYKELGKKAEAKDLVNRVVADVAPRIEKEAVRKYAPAIMEHGAQKAIEGLAAYASNDVNPNGTYTGVSNEEVQRVANELGRTPDMQDIEFFRRLKSLEKINGGSIGAAPDSPAEGLSSLNLQRGV